MTSAFSTDAATALPGPAWLVERRRAAAARFAEATLPTAEEEVWRYSRIGELDLSKYRLADGPASTIPAFAADLVERAAADAVAVVVVDGTLVEVRGDAAGLTIGTPEAAEGSALGAAGGASDALRDLHDAFCTPVECTVDAGAQVRVALVAITTTEGIATFPHLTVSAGANASVDVVEVHASPDGIADLSLPVTELIVGRDARVRHRTVQFLGDASWQIGNLVSTVDAGGSVRAGTVAFGGDYARLRVDTTLAGRGATGDLLAGYYGRGSQALDFRTFQDHAAPDTTSNLLFKGVLDDSSASVYTGLIKIRPGARGSQAFQTNRNLKLSPDTFAESVPNLEIENNEVQCSHASTVGPVDPEQLFYLESRGVPTERAERLIVRGVFDEVLDALDLGAFDAPVRDALDAQIAAHEIGAPS